ncbi:MAG: PKD domain-containing protein, partial [Candidatus Bathyarchaeota archaeon]
MIYETQSNASYLGSYKKNKIKQLFSITLVAFLLLSTQFIIFSSIVYAEEPSTSTIFTQLGITDVSPIDIETFSPGIYKATLLAEFAQYHNISILSYYAVGTDDYKTIFTGPEGATGFWGGFALSYETKIFTIDQSFGISMLSAYRYFSETDLNPDSPIKHAQIYEDLNSPNTFIICFEDSFEGYDLDYNDLIFSLEKINPPEIQNVIRTPLNPLANQEVEINAEVIKGTTEIDSVLLSYNVNSSGWTNTSMTHSADYFTAKIPAQPDNTQISYKVHAYDINGYSDISDLYSYSTLIPNKSPNAIISNSPSLTYTNEEINFDASESSDPDGIIVSFHWDFGDGTEKSEMIVTHSYEDDGKYNVILTVTDDDGFISSDVATITIYNREPMAIFTQSTTVINSNENVQFDASQSYDTDGTIDSYI